MLFLVCNQSHCCHSYAEFSVTQAACWYQKLQKTCTLQELTSHMTEPVADQFRGGGGRMEGAVLPSSACAPCLCRDVASLTLFKPSSRSPSLEGHPDTAHVVTCAIIQRGKGRGATSTGEVRVCGGKTTGVTVGAGPGSCQQDKCCLFVTP